MIFYRFVSSPVYGDFGLISVEIDLQEYEAVKETPKGYWIVTKGYAKYDWAKRRFLLKRARKKFAYDNPQEAWESYKIRALWRLKHLSRQIDVAEMTLMKVDKKAYDQFLGRLL